MNPTNELRKENLLFKRYVKASALFHVAIFLFFAVQITFFSTPTIDFEQAIRVDIVGLPPKANEPPPAAEVAKPEPTPAPTPPEPNKPVAKKEPVAPQLPSKPVAAEPDSIRLEKTKSQQKKALEKLKQMQALADIEQEIESESRRKKVAPPPTTPYKGNIINAGTELRGLQKLQAEKYIDEITKHFLSHWTAPAYCRNRNLKTRGVVRLDESGNVLGREILQSSGNSSFDELVLAAILKSSPVPPPPEKFSRIAQIEGFLINFSPDSQ